MFRLITVISSHPVSHKVETLKLKFDILRTVHRDILV